MTTTSTETLIIGGGQAGLAMSAHLRDQGVPHLIVERRRIAERWREERWDSFVANGPAWHDRFPNRTFACNPDSFATRDQIVEYFVAYAQQIEAPLRSGVEVLSLRAGAAGVGFEAHTSEGLIRAANVVVATGPFQRPLIPAMVPASDDMRQMHSAAYRNPTALPPGAVLVVGAGSSGAQIADELLRAGRRVFLSVGPHNRPPRRYRGHDFVWWLGVLGEWDVKTVARDTEHVTISVSGAHGGHTVDFRELAGRGITLLGTAAGHENGVMQFRPDLANNIARGDANYLATLDAADAFAAANHLDLPEEPEARRIGADPDCISRPVAHLNLGESAVSSIIWATGYATDFSWIQLEAFDPAGRPDHQRGVSTVPGLYFLGLPWLSRRASAFIWGVWHDAQYLSAHIATRSPAPAR